LWPHCGQLSLVLRPPQPQAPCWCWGVMRKKRGYPLQMRLRGGFPTVSSGVNLRLMTKCSLMGGWYPWGSPPLTAKVGVLSRFRAPPGPPTGCSQLGSRGEGWSWTQKQHHFIVSLSFFFLFYYSSVHTRLGSFLPPAPTPSWVPLETSLQTALGAPVLASSIKALL
jgi:hypothetical protein